MLNIKKVFSIKMHCFFFAFIEMLDFFSQEIRPPFSMLNAKRFEIVYVLPLPILSNIKENVTFPWFTGF
jgi:hypothetical protein